MVKGRHKKFNKIHTPREKRDEERWSKGSIDS